MRPGDAAPDHAELGAALEGLGLVDVGEALLLLLVLTMFERRWGERVSEFFFSCFEGGSAREREAAAVAAAARSGSIAMGPLFLSSHLAEVELRLALGLDALDLDERRVVVLRALPPVWNELERQRKREREFERESTWVSEIGKSRRGKEQERPKNNSLFLSARGRQEQKSDLQHRRHPVAFSDFSLRRGAGDDRCESALVAERPKKQRSDGRCGVRGGGLARRNRDRRPGAAAAAAGGGGQLDDSSEGKKA